MTLAATLTTRHISDTISAGNPGVFMHGPTFMANPLACAVALASTKLLLASPWEARLTNIEKQLNTGLAPCNQLAAVNEVRVLGGIGVVELHEPVNMTEIQGRFVEQGVWIRPFGKLVYVMPPYVVSDKELSTLCQAIYRVIKDYHQ